MTLLLVSQIYRASCISSVTVFTHTVLLFSLKAPDEEFEEYLRHILGERCTGDRNEVTCCLLSLLLCFSLLKLHLETREK